MKLLASNRQVLFTMAETQQKPEKKPSKTCGQRHVSLTWDSDTDTAILHLAIQI